MIYVIATMKIEVDTRELVTVAARPCIEASRAEPGCRRYDLLTEMFDPTAMVFVEEWDSREALEAHFATQHVAAWREAREPYVVSSTVEVIHADKVERL